MLSVDGRNTTYKIKRRKRLSKPWYSHAMGCCLSIKGKDYWYTQQHEGKIKCIMLSYRSQSLKATYCMILFLWQFGKDKTIDRNMSVAVKNWQSKKGDQRGPQESFRELWRILTLIVVTWCMHLSKLRTVHWQEWTLLNVNYILTNLTRGKKKNSLNYKHKNQHIP